MGSPAPARSKAAGVDLATAQEAIAAFQYLSGEGVLRAWPCPYFTVADTMQGQLEGPAEVGKLRALYFTDGETEAYAGGRDSLKSAQQVVARPVLEPSCPEVLAVPVPSLPQDQGS